MTAFAHGTEVPASKTRGEIEALVQRYGAAQFSSGWSGTRSAIGFVAHGRMVRFELALPDAGWARAVLKKQQRYQYREPPEGEVTRTREAEERRRWRCLLLAIKAKLEVVQTGIAAFEEEFLAHIVTRDNMTVYEALKLAEQDGQKLLPPVAP